MSKPDYARLIDAETWDYMRKLDASYPPGAVNTTVPEQRSAYDAMCKVFHQPRPPEVAVEDSMVGGVPCRRYSVGEAPQTVIYYHGGGFVVGGLDSHDDVCAEICARTGFEVISVDYRLAPEHVFPAHFDDAYAAFQAIAEERPGPLILCGDSAGGNLAAAVTHHARDRVCGQVLIYPGLASTMDGPSYTDHAEAPQLTAADIAFYAEVRLGGQAAPSNDARYAPLDDPDFAGLPPTVLVVAECDPLASDGDAYRDRLVAAGGQAVCFVEAGMVHGCLRARHMSRRAETFFERVLTGICAMGSGEWPYPSEVP